MIIIKAMFATISVFAVIFGIIVGVKDLFGPQWPTEPDFSLDVPYTTGDPFDVPFSIGNRSGLFDIRKLTVACELVDVRTTDHYAFQGISVVSNANNLLAAFDTRPYTCPFHNSILGNHPVCCAVIRLIAAYQDPEFYPWSVPKKTYSKIYTLDRKTSPMRWIPGDPIL